MAEALAMPRGEVSPPPRRGWSPGIDRVIRAVATSPASAHREIADRFWDDQGAASPMRETSAAGEPLLTFLWRADPATTHAVLVGINRVTHDVEHARMTPIPGTDIWYATFALEDDWRGSYTVLPVETEDDAEEILAEDPRWAIRIIRERGLPDPRNGSVLTTHSGSPASVAALPAAPSQPWLVTPPHTGTTTALRTPSGRKAWIHRPAGDDEDPRPLVVVLDGQVWHGSGDAARTVDNLAAAGLRAPHVLMLDSGDPARRMADLRIDGGMSEEIVGEILPWARSLLPLSGDPRDIVVSGESLGGLTALKTAFDHPGVVGAALSQSASLWHHDMVERAGAAPEGLRLFLAVGTRESTLLAPHRALLPLLRERFPALRYEEYNGGHDMACWRGYLGEGLRFLLGD